MTAAAGFPIVSATAGVPAVSSAPKPAHTKTTSFRAGLEALVNSAPTSPAQTSPVRATSIEAKYSDAVQSELGETSDSGDLAAPHNAKPALSAQNRNQNKPAATTAPASRFEAATQSQLQHTQYPASAAALQVSRSLQQNPAVLPATTAAKAHVPVAPGKQTSREHAAQQKQSATANGDSKTTFQTTVTSGEALMPAPGPISSPASNTGHAIPPRTESAPDHAALGAKTERDNTSSVFTVPASTKLESKTSSITPVDDPEPDHTTEAHAAQSLRTNTESIAQSASALPSPDTDSLLKVSTAQANPGSASNTLQPILVGSQSLAGASQAHAPQSHGPAPRERGPVQRDLLSASAQQTVTIASQATLARDSSGITGVPTERASGPALSAQSSTVSVATRDTFTALDADPGQPSTTWIHTSPRQVEAGYQDPSLGWVSVRADLTPGGLHASVVPNSPEAAQALGSHLSGLNAYLAEHHGGTITASLATPENHSSTQESLAQNPGQHGQSGARQQQESSEATVARTVSSQTISTGSTQGSKPAVLAPAHSGLISVIA